jgi:hypothetical protein
MRYASHSSHSLLNLTAGTAADVFAQMPSGRSNLNKQQQNFALHHMIDVPLLFLLLFQRYYFCFVSVYLSIIRNVMRVSGRDDVTIKM